MTERTHEMSTADLATARPDEGASEVTRTDTDLRTDRDLRLDSDLRPGADPDFDTLLGADSTPDSTPNRTHEAVVQSQHTERVEVPAYAAPTAAADSSVTGTATTGPLMPDQDREGFRARWTDVQTRFVDEPRESVQQADALVAELMQQLAATFADERARLEKQWDNDTDVATDSLRTAFQRYRSFFERLLAT